MKGKNHLITGVLGGTAAAVFTYNGNLIASGILLAASTLGSVVPDIDLPNSTLGKKIKPISFIINKLFGHRTITHTPLWLIPLFLLLQFFISSSKPEYAVFALIGYINGFVLHLLGDLFSKSGIPMFYPFKRKRYSLSPFKSGSLDWLVTTIVCVACLIFWYFLYKYNN